MRAVAVFGWCVCLLALTPQSLEAKVVKLASIGNWNIGAVYAQDETLSSCVATASYSSGVSLGFVITRDLHWSMFFSDARWNLIVGQEFNLAYKIDSGNVRVATAFATSPQTIRAQLPDNGAVFEEFRRSQVLSTSSGNDSGKFILTDASTVLVQLMQCASSGQTPRSSLAVDGGPAHGTSGATNSGFRPIN